MIDLNRLFLAFPADDSTRASCHAAARQLGMRASHHGRVVPPEDYHLTAAFLGNTVSRSHEQDLLTRLQIPSSPPLSLVLDTASSFKQTRESIWWLGPRRDNPYLLTFRQSLVDRLKALGLEIESKRFTPHVTIVRHAKLNLAKTTIAPIPWNLDAIALYRSEVSPQGSRYTELKRWAIKVGAKVASGDDQLGLNF